MTPVEELLQEVMALRKEVAGLRMRRNQTVVPGTISKRQGARYEVTLDDQGDDGQPVLTPLLRAAEQTGKRGGGVSRFSAYGVGEAVLVVSPNGEIGSMSAVLPWIDTEDDPSPGSVEADGFIQEHGSARLEVRNGFIGLTVDGKTISFDGTTLSVPAGVRIDHNGRNIGQDHTHSGIERGGADTDPPNP